MNILKSIYIISAIALFLFNGCTSKSLQKSVSKPNVILIMTDDQGYGDLGHTGNPIIKTRAIDAFSKEAINLTNYHVGTTCTPTRAGLLTGRNCNRNGAWHTIMGASSLNGDEVTMANVFQQNGYKTGMFGKWHLGDNHPSLPNDKGFEDAFFLKGGGVGQTPDYWNNNYFDDTYFRNGVPEKVKGYCTDVWFDEAIKYIENKKDQPFFCYLSLNAPHSPYNVPEEYYNIYKNENTILESQKRFYGMITNIDDNFSKLHAKLDELKIADNTILIFTTDNGTSNGYKIDKETGEIHGYNAGMRGTKASEYDGGHRVPFMIRWPNGSLSGGKKLNELVAHVDLLPTLTSLAGIKFTSEKVLDGIDVSNCLKNGEKIKQRMLVTDTQRVPWPEKGKQSSVMDGSWRLVNGSELYNVKNDPGQQNNVAAQHPERVVEMNNFYNTWWDDVIKESKFTVIDLGLDSVDVLTCMDIHSTGQFPNWNQEMIRKGAALQPANFLVNFTQEGHYKISLSRWPEESGLTLESEANDAVKETAYTNARSKGIAFKFKKAFLKIGEKEYSVAVDNTEKATSFEIETEKGEKDLTGWFEMEDGTLTNAFYVYVEKLN
ncbi:arylsulfatase [Saccharicrinis sp. 156]|uniref:arylsulfatase n=1 Tax=Saccharicrinis sp. 156 TaxID=3417574 RepID=UPI003D33B0AE